MPKATLEQRVALLEKLVAGLQAGLRNGVQTPDWRSTVGMFSHNEEMKAIDAAGQALRAKERRRARRRAKR